MGFLSVAAGSIGLHMFDGFGANKEPNQVKSTDAVIGGATAWTGLYVNEEDVEMRFFSTGTSGASIALFRGTDWTDLEKIHQAVGDPNFDFVKELSHGNYLFAVNRHSAGSVTLHIERADLA